MSKHTPGPWQSHETIMGKKYIVSDDEDAKKYYEGKIAKVPDRRGEGRANARLISSAPDLLAALKSAQGLLALSDVAHLMGQLGETSALHGTLNEIHKAILKAEDSA